MSRFEFRYLFDGKLCDVVTIDFNKEHVYILADVLRLSRDDVLLVFFPEEVRS